MTTQQPGDSVTIAQADVNKLAEKLEELKLATTTRHSGKRRWFNGVIAIVHEHFGDLSPAFTNAADALAWLHKDDPIVDELREILPNLLAWAPSLKDSESYHRLEALCRGEITVTSRDGASAPPSESVDSNDLSRFYAAEIGASAPASYGSSLDLIGSGRSGGAELPDPLPPVEGERANLVSAAGDAGNSQETGARQAQHSGGNTGSPARYAQLRSLFGLTLYLIREQGYANATEWNGELFIEDVFPALGISSYAEFGRYAVGGDLHVPLPDMDCSTAPTTFQPTRYTDGSVSREYEEQEAKQPDDLPPVSRDLVAKIRAAQFRYFESKKIEFYDSDLMGREEAQFIAREIVPLEREAKQPEHVGGVTDMVGLAWKAVEDKYSGHVSPEMIRVALRAIKRETAQPIVCREEFERWAKDAGQYMVKRDGDYWSLTVRNLWRGWQAAWNALQPDANDTDVASMPQTKTECGFTTGQPDETPLPWTLDVLPSGLYQWDAEKRVLLNAACRLERESIGEEVSDNAVLRVLGLDYSLTPIKCLSLIKAAGFVIRRKSPQRESRLHCQKCGGLTCAAMHEPLCRCPESWSIEVVTATTGDTSDDPAVNMELQWRKSPEEKV